MKTQAKEEYLHDVGLGKEFSDTTSKHNSKEEY